MTTSAPSSASPDRRRWRVEPRRALRAPRPSSVIVPASRTAPGPAPVAAPEPDAMAGQRQVGGGRVAAVAPSEDRRRSRDRLRSRSELGELRRSAGVLEQHGRKHLVGVLAQARRRRHRRDAMRAVDLDRRAERRQRAVAADARPRPPSRDGVPEDRPARGPRSGSAWPARRPRCRRVEPVRRSCASRKTASTSGISPSRWATRSRLVANRGSRSHSGCSTRAAEPAPELLGEDRDDQVAVARGQRLVRHDRGVAGAHAARHPSVGPEVLRDVGQQRDLAVEQREVDVRALPGARAAEQRAGDGEARRTCRRRDRPSAGPCAPAARPARR